MSAPDHREDGRDRVERQQNLQLFFIDLSFIDNDNEVAVRVPLIDVDGAKRSEIGIRGLFSRFQ